MEPNLNDSEIKSEINPSLEVSHIENRSKWISYALIVVGVLLLVGGGVFAYFKFSSPQMVSHCILENFSQSNKIAKINDKAAEINLHLKMNVLKASAEELAEEVKPERKLPKMPSAITTAATTILGLTIETPKDVYKVGELFEGKITQSALQNDFNGVTTVTLSKDGVENTVVYSIFYSAMGVSSVDTFKAFKIEGTTYTEEESFDKPGELVLTLKSYQCSDLKLTEDQCDSTYINVPYLKDFVPVSTASKTITVLPGDSNQESNGELLAPETEIKADDQVATSLLDCVGSEDGNCMTPFLDQFTKNLESCTPSTGETPIGFEAFMGLLRGYEVKGLLDGNCVIDFWFLDIPVEKMPPEADPIPAELLNKNMTCNLTNDQRTIEAVGKWVGCEGPLKVELDKLGL